MDTSLFIIDDDPVHHKQVEYLIQQSCERIKHQSFFHASDALVYILDNNESEVLPDVILLDLNMPSITGWGFVELFEAMSSSLAKPIDIIILTSTIQQSDIERASQYCSVKGLIPKPLTLTLLKDILNSSFISSNRVSKYL